MKKDESKKKFQTDHSSAEGTESKNKEVKRKGAEQQIEVAAKSENAASPSASKAANVMLYILVGVLCAALIAGVVLGAIWHVNNEKLVNTYTYQYKSNGKVGVSGEVLGTVERVKPVSEMKNGGLAEYPVYGKPLTSVLGTDDDKVAARNALIAESNSLCATGTANAGGGGNYLWMDKDGYLYNGTTSEPQTTGRQLYQHTASVGMYGGNVDDAEPRLAKKVSFKPRGYGSYSVTGLYAPAGEVIKIEISEEDMNATGGITIHIGQALYNGQANNIWTAKNQMQRMPVILNTMTVNKNTATLENGVYTAYVGSFLGGPLYIRNTLASFTATISGGVAYSHFILGYTTPQEFENNAKSTAPYFDLEVWEYGVLHSGSKAYAKNFSYDDLYKAAVLWEKVSLVTTTGSNQGVVFLYDPFVAAGAAVAFPGRSSVNCPADWMVGSLNYNSLVTTGSWGNFHEYHHNFQGYGVGNGGEVTNNGMTLVSYALFTKISSARRMGNYGAEGLGGWNRYTSATWALEQNLKIARPNESPENGDMGLSLYATLLHNFGPDCYIQAKYNQQINRYGQSYEGYLKAWQNITHNDMSYYFNDVLGASDDFGEYAVDGYSMFVPVSCVYQTGRSYMYDGEKKYIQTMQPFVVPFGKDFNIDLSKYVLDAGGSYSGSIIIPDGFTYTVKSVSSPDYGSIKKVNDYNYIYTPGENLQSGKIIVTLEITKDDGAFEVDDVDLVLQFEQTREWNKSVLERDTYIFDDGAVYTDAEVAFNANYKGYKDKISADHVNPVQNCNTDIWYYPATDSNPDHDEAFKAPQNAVAEVRGKLYFADKGTYRIYLRGRLNCAAYYSLDGKDYSLGATIKLDSVPSNSALFRPSDEKSYFDLTVDAETWVYFKTVLIVETQKTTSYVGLGMSKWTEPMFTIREQYFDKDNKEITDKDAAVRTETHYYDLNGHEVSEAEANSSQLIAPSATAQPAYLNAYRSSYEFPQNKDFTTDYFYTRKHVYDYTDNVLNSSEQKVVSTDYDAGKSWNFANYPVENLTDGNTGTFIHTRNWGTSQDRAIRFTIDLGEVKSVNRMILFTQYRPNGDYHMPKNFTLEVSTDNETYAKVKDFVDVPRNGTISTVDFDEVAFRYYRLTITGSTGSHVILGEIQMWHINELLGANQYSPSDSTFAFSPKWTSVQIQSTYGNAYLGKSGDKVKFEFEGSRFAVLSSAAFKSNFEVIIDGVKAQSIAVKEPAEGVYASFISQQLSNGKHTVEIRCKGQTCIDSFAFYPNTSTEAEQ